MLTPILMCLVALFLLAGGCCPSKAGGLPVYPPRGTDVYISIPPGYYPPPGTCRIWLPGVPPERQPPPGPCSEIEVEVPPGAWLIHQDIEPGYDGLMLCRYRKNVIKSVRYYDPRNGRFVRERKIRNE